MHLRYWGDSYDLVKQSLLRWLRPLGDWSVHPMFTEHVALEQTEQFAAFLAARLLSGAVLTSSTNRADYLACASGCSNLFLDPDTGLRLKSMRGKRAPQFLFAGELVALARARPSYLTMVFDQSHPRGGTRQSLEGKLKYLAAAGISAFAYDSHACFIVSSCQAEIIAEAHAHILTESRLPPSRLVVQLPSSQVCAGAA